MLVTKKDKGIVSADQLDGKKYASYEGRFEMAIVQQLIKQAGGFGQVIEVKPPKLDCFDAVLRDEADATWVFMCWEGIIAQERGIELNAFPLSSSASPSLAVPYGYSPVLLANPKMLTTHAASLRAFLMETERGFQYATGHPDEAVEDLWEGSQQHSSLVALGKDFLVRSQTALAEGGHYLDRDGKWGRMEASRWTQFLEWLMDHQLLTDRNGEIIAKEVLSIGGLLFSNEFL